MDAIFTMLEALFSKEALIGCVAVIALAFIGVISIIYMIWSMISG